MILRLCRYKHGICGLEPFYGDAYTYSPAEYCDKSIDKHCFIAKHFDWCLEHEATSLESDGTYDVHRTFKLRNDDGSEEIKTEIVKERKCSHPDTREYGCCNVVQSGRMVFTTMRHRDTELKLDYGEDEWEEEERIEWMSEQMAKDSP